MIWGVDIKGQVAWLAWHGSQLCVRNAPLPTVVKITYTCKTVGPSYDVDLCYFNRLTTGNPKKKSGKDNDDDRYDVCVKIILLSFVSLSQCF